MSACCGARQAPDRFDIAAQNDYMAEAFTHAELHHGPPHRAPAS